MRQAFDIESINLDDLIATALNDPKVVAGDIKAFRGINFTDLNTAYHQFCKKGGSTITQQVVKNLLVGDDVSYERKIREMIVASRLESTLSKQEILELYLNSAYLGRGAWGVEMAARSYFGKSAQDLTIGEGAMLASLLKGPSFFNPDRHPDRAKERLAYVLGRTQEDGVISAEDKNLALPERGMASVILEFLKRELKRLSNTFDISATSPWSRALTTPRRRMTFS